MHSCIIVGLGKSGLAAAHLFENKKIPYFVFDSRSKNELELDNLKYLKSVYSSETELKNLDKTISKAIVSPGISPESSIVQILVKNNIEISTEIDLALEYYNKDWLSITGTNGKSTLTQLCSEIVDGYVAAGNIGYPPSDAIIEKADKKLCVELSSYQIEYMSFKNTSKFSIFLSFAPDHIERHKSLELYFNVKWKLIEKTVERNDGFSLISEEVLESALKYGKDVPLNKVYVISNNKKYPLRVEAQPNKVLVVTDKSIKSFDIPSGIVAKGINLAAAIWFSSFYKNETDSDLEKRLKDFSGLEYRFQKVSVRNNFLIINDSKSTNVHSTLYALSQIERPVVLLLGGVGKMESYKPILNYKNKIKTLICFGKDGPVIAKELNELEPTTHPNLREALKNIQDLLKYPNGNILFSPACASFDEFKNFEERGEFFNNHI